MGRPTYVCTTCSEHFTRKYSAKRHNITVHHNNGGGEIVPLVEYLVGRNSGKYEASRPSWYRRAKEKRIHNFGHAADSMGGQYHHYPQYQQRAQSPSMPLPSLPPPASQGVSPSQPMNTTNDHGTPSQETVLKIQEFKRLVYRHPIFSNPDMVIQCVTHFSIINGDNTLLDEKLEQLRALDAISK